MTQYMKSRPRASNQEPLFATEEGNSMSRAWFASRLRLLCQTCGLPPERYTPHSFRIGAATTAASVAPVSTLKAMGRWSSSAYERYFRPEAQAILDAQKAMRPCNCWLIHKGIQISGDLSSILACTSTSVCLEVSVIMLLAPLTGTSM